jgi:hypothetical protein
MEMFIVLSDSTCGRWCSPAHFYWLKSVSKAADGVTKAFPNVANSHMNSFQKAAATSIKHPQILFMYLSSLGKMFL